MTNDLIGSFKGGGNTDILIKKKKKGITDMY